MIAFGILVHERSDVMGVYLDDQQTEKLSRLLEEFQKLLDGIKSGDIVYKDKNLPKANE